MSALFSHDAAGTAASAWDDDDRWSSLAPLDVLDTAARLVVLAAHPDDETLGAGGLLVAAHRRGLPVHVVLMTAGEGSHPRSPTYDVGRLASVRREEAREALEILAPGADLTFLGLPDGAVAAHGTDALESVVDLLGDARDTVLAAPWRHDGHPDHEAAGRVAATAALRTGASLVEYPVWFWHWGNPDDAPWPAMWSLGLGPEDLARKQAAIAAHRSQVAPLSPAPGDEVLLGPAVLAHFLRDVEVVVVTPHDRADEGADDALDLLHQDSPDPWGVDVRWYEKRKRDLLLASLPHRHVGRAIEVGCSTGAVSAALAARCGELVSLDSSPAAVRAARARLGSLAHVRVDLARVPREWPDDEWTDGEVDLVVVSEVGYFLSPLALDGLVERIRDCLAPDGVVVLCHWRHPVRGWVLDGPAVHDRVLAADLRPCAARYVDRDVELLVLAHPDQWPEPSA